MVCVILVAEDEVFVRNIVRHILEGEGHDVFAAADGAEALAISRRYEGVIDMLITDVVMPRMGGLELLAEIRKERPEIKVLVMSGQVPAEWAAEHGRLPFLHKPFLPEVLRRKVRQVLDYPEGR